jgi:murein DD-endopeptidase MepM/ murein hydrolase activator NlpD
VALLLAALFGPAAAAEAPPSVQRLEAREAVLSQQARTSEELARRQARAAYRLARRRQLGFMAMPETRLEDARALDLALMTVRRSAGEARAIRGELGRVQGERRALAAAAASAAPAPAGGPPRFLRPVRGAVVGEPGLRRDPVTGVEVRHDALQLLARMNEPVQAPASGVVRRVEAQPQGGFAVVMAHERDWVTVLSGLREVQVAPGQILEGGSPLGLAGRNLDGAAVVSVELWHGRRVADARLLLQKRRR